MTQAAIVVRVEAASGQRNCPDRDACPYENDSDVIPGRGRHFWLAREAAS